MKITVAVMLIYLTVIKANYITDEIKIYLNHYC